MRARGRSRAVIQVVLSIDKINNLKEKLMSYNKNLTDKQNEIISENAIREAGNF
jgi:hypothetical protein